MKKSLLIKLAAGVLLLALCFSLIACGKDKKDEKTAKVYAIMNGNPDMTLTLDGLDAKITTVVTTSLGDETMAALGLADALRDTVVKEIHTTILNGTFKTLDNGGDAEVRCAHTLLGLSYTGDGAENVLRIEIERHKNLAAEARTAGDPDGTASQYDAYVEMLESGEPIEATRLGYGQYDMGYIFSLNESEMTAVLKKQMYYDENGVVYKESTLSEDGAVLSEIKYKDGVLVEVDEYYESTIPRHKIVYQAPDVPDYERFYSEKGELVRNLVYDSNGKLNRADYYDEAGCYHGVDYYASEQKRTEEIYDENGVFSVYNEFSEDGAVTYEEKPVGDGTFEGFYFENGVKTGRKILNRQGVVIYEATFDSAGNIITEVHYDENGEPIL